MSQEYFRKNFSRAYLANALGAADTQMVVKNTSTLPIADVSQIFRAVIWDYLTYPDPADDPDVEIVIAVWESGFTYTLTRGQEGTQAKDHPASSKVSLNYTAGVSLDDLFMIGRKKFVDEYIPNFFVRYNASLDKFELHSGNIITAAGIPYGLSALRPDNPEVGDWYFATDTGSVYKCSEDGVWTSIIANISFTALGDVPASYSGKSLQALRCNVGETGLEFFVNGFTPNGMQAFTTSGTFIPPAGFTKFYVRMWGGGSSGTQGRARNGVQPGWVGSGGGGGCYVEAVVTIETSIFITVGTGQSFGNVLATDTSLPGLIVAGGGKQAVSTNGIGQGAVAGAGGTVNSAISNYLSIPGKDGSLSFMTNDFAATYGGDAFCGSGGRSSSSNTVANGTFPGGGGAGDSSGSGTPGKGADGLVLIYW